MANRNYNLYIYVKIATGILVNHVDKIFHDVFLESEGTCLKNVSSRSEPANLHASMPYIETYSESA